MKGESKANCLRQGELSLREDTFSEALSEVLYLQKRDTGRLSRSEDLGESYGAISREENVFHTDRPKETIFSQIFSI